MTDAARNALAEGALQPTQEVHVTLLPSVIRANRMEPIRVSVFGEGHDHKVTVTRNAAGEFVASASPIRIPGRTPRGCCSAPSSR